MEGLPSLGVQSLLLDFEEQGEPGIEERHVKVVARAAELQSVRHPRLARYVCSRLEERRLMLCCEHTPRSLRSWLDERKQLPEAAVRTVARGLFEGLAALAAQGLVHVALSPLAILFADERDDSVVLAEWGTHHVTDGGRLVQPRLFVGSLHYSAPEAFGDTPTPKAAVWAAGVCLLEMLTGHNPFADGDTLVRAFTDKDVVMGLLEVAELDRCSRDLRELLVGCLSVNVKQRFSASEALHSPFCGGSVGSRLHWEPAPFLRSSFFTAPSVESLFPHMTKLATEPSRAPSADSLDGGNGKSDSKGGKPGSALLAVPHEPAAVAEQSMEEIANALLDRGATLLPELPRTIGPLALPDVLGEPLKLHWDARVVSIPKEEVLNRLAFVPKKDEVRTVFELWKGRDPKEVSLDVRENDVIYQQMRVDRLAPLIAARDVKAVQREATIDVPPVLRSDVWAVLLNVPPWPVCAAEWNAIDVTADTPADHQIDVDVPRCNARHELIGTPEGRKRLTRVLKAWVLSNPGLEYWQGLDSLSAPFVAIAWDGGEDRAFALLQRMVRRFLSGMFLQKNTSQLQTQLIVFSQLLAYHDPQLFLHLQAQQFSPELYAIPWFLTLFTHILPIDSTLRLWDFLFLHDASMIHFISIAVMRQLRKRLLAIDFNEMVLFFSELHSKQGVDMVRVLSDAVKICDVTPNSLATDHFFGQEKPSLSTLQEHFSPKLFVADFVTLVKEGRVAVLVFDVRSAEEWKACHLEGSINIVPSAVDMKAVAQLRKKKPIIVVIAPEGLEYQLPNLLVKAGIPRVAYLSGGMDALLAISADCIKIVHGKE